MNTWPILLILFLFSPLPLPAQDHGAGTCAPLSESTRTSLVHYIASRFDLAPDILLEDHGFVEGSCYRRLTAQATVPPRVITLYLSPDQRFLSPEVLDTTADPDLEKQRMARRVQEQLMADFSPAAGGERSKVTIVEFADFQCPYCKRFSDLLKSLGAARDDIQVIFKQYPLPMHNWARRAALASICASKQGNASFWALHDSLFLSQSEITPENIDDHLKSFVERDPSMHAGAFWSCMKGREPEDVLARDIQLAHLYRIDGTPTIFINGRRTTGFQSLEALKAAINEASAAQSLVPGAR